MSPLSPFQIMFSKVLAMAGVILLATALALYGVLHPGFTPMKDRHYSFSADRLVFTTAGFGLMAATLAKNQGASGHDGALPGGPMLLLSGITSPFESMPRWCRRS